jgi:pyrroline-5-carboxylate reductase
MTKANKTALVGAGQMGGALATGWLARKRGGVAPENLVIVDPAPGEAVQALIDKHELTRVDAMTLKLSSEIDMVVLAVKPQSLAKVGEFLAPLLPDNCAILSILAGTPIKRLAEVFGQRAIIRAMPNLPSAIGAGISVCVANESGDARRTDVERLLKVAGAVEWVDDERLIGPVTAVSGSGPAYVFLLAEALAGAGFAEGLPRELAEKLARETIIGAGALLAASEKTPQELRRAVASPGGTTQAALDVLMGGGGGLPELVRQAVNAAERRSRQMAAANNNR